MKIFAADTPRSLSTTTFTETNFTKRQARTISLQQLVRNCEQLDLTQTKADSNQFLQDYLSVTECGAEDLAMRCTLAPRLQQLNSRQTAHGFVKSYRGITT